MACGRIEGSSPPPVGDPADPPSGYTDSRGYAGITGTPNAQLSSSNLVLGKILRSAGFRKVPVPTYFDGLFELKCGFCIGR